MLKTLSYYSKSRDSSPELIRISNVSEHTEENTAESHGSYQSLSTTPIDVQIICQYNEYISS